MRLELFANVLNLLCIGFPSARRALFALRRFIHDIASELVLLDLPVHEPIAVEANQVEPVETLAHPNKVGSLRKSLFLRCPPFSPPSSGLGKILETDGTAAPDGVVVFGEYLSALFVQVIDDP